MAGHGTRRRWIAPAAVGVLAVVAVVASTVVSASGLATAWSVGITPGTTYLLANGQTSQPLTATVRDSAGDPLPGAAVVWSVSGNAVVTPAVSTSDASGHASTTVISSTTAGHQVITAASGLASGTASLVQYTCAAVVHLLLSATSVASTGPVAVPATVTVTDYNSPPDPVPGAALTFTTSGNDTVGPVTDLGNGTYTTTVYAPGPGTQSITATAAGTCHGTATSTLDVYGPPAQVALQLTRASIPATGVAQPAPLRLPIADPQGQIRQPYVPEPAMPAAIATVTDAGGNRVLNQTVGFVASGGVRFGSVTNNGDGTYSAPLISSSTPDVEQITATASPSGVASVPVSLTETFGALHVAGTSVLDTNGRPVVLRGLNFGPDAPDPSGLVNEFPEGAVYDGLVSAWHANVLRATIDLDQWMQSCVAGPDGSLGGGYDANYQAAFKEYVAAATERGIYVILALAKSPRFTCDPAGSTGQISAERDAGNASDDALSFWSSVAGTFGSNPLVGFELYNEPHIRSSDVTAGTNPDAVWLNGGLVDGTWTAAGMQQMYDAVRHAGATNLVFVDGNDWANTPPSELLGSAASASAATDPPASDIVYVAHWYTCQGRDPSYGMLGDSSTTPYQCATVAPPAPTDSCPSAGSVVPGWDDVAAGLGPWVTWRAATGAPFIEDEFGWPGNAAPVDSCFDQASIAYDEVNGIPWTAFNFDRFPDFWNVATDPGSGDFSPTVSGGPVRAGLAANTSQAY